jgi:hypothetical protein
MRTAPISCSDDDIGVCYRSRQSLIVKLKSAYNGTSRYQQVHGTSRLKYCTLNTPCTYLCVYDPYHMLEVCGPIVLFLITVSVFHSPIAIKLFCPHFVNGLSLFFLICVTNCPSQTFQGNRSAEHNYKYPTRLFLIRLVFPFLPHIKQFK